jgi:hypothetical protein
VEPTLIVLYITRQVVCIRFYDVMRTGCRYVVAVRSGLPVGEVSVCLCVCLKANVSVLVPIFFRKLR